MSLEVLKHGFLLKKKGFCENCMFAELEFPKLTLNDGTTIQDVICEHELACCRIAEMMEKKINDNRGT